MEKCAQLASNRPCSKKSGHNPDVGRKLNSLVEKHVALPTRIRNKIAHGQASFAFSERWSINQDVTNALRNLDPVEIDKDFESLETLSKIIQDLISSPNKAHFRDYYVQLCDYEAALDRAEKWDSSTKRPLLIAKSKRPSQPQSI